ncbi:MAG: hypothetical protein H7Y62_08860 [Hyphomicrobium sp.]|nr:hypothetical protein [Hyphomicrobium sp.]
MAGQQEDLTQGVDAALAGDWETAHAIAQRHEGDSAADWLHAVLHKIEGDTGNARYWYRRTTHHLDEFGDPSSELTAIRALLSR